MGALWRVLLLISRCAKRVFDVSLSSLLVLVCSPFLIVFSSVQALSGRVLLTGELRLGRWGVPFRLLELNVQGGLSPVLRRIGFHRLARLLNVMRGDLSLIGPQPARPGDLDLRQRAAQKRSSIRPGMISLWWLRRQANIGFTTELDVDLEYIDGHSVRGDVGIALRSLPALLYGSGPASAPDRVNVLGIPIRNLTMDEALDTIIDAAEGDRPRQLCFVNTDCVNKAQSDARYHALLRSADAVLADGIGIRIAGKILRQEIRQNVNGTDLFPLLCARLEGSETGMYLLGARPGVVDAVRDWVASNYPRTRISGARHGYFEAEELAAVLDDIRTSGARILLVALGSPQQDVWIAENLARTGATMAMGVGGLFDFYSGNIPRAPQWMRELSLEWVFRLIQEPSRMWKRYLLGNIVFLMRVAWSLMRRGKTEPQLQGE
jgi:N-acetylglucosaminyldiphosphoundecaprenol N-acetyl-beta-D-mannosaminyltransferase